MKQRRIFFFDLDGTLLTDEKKVSEKTYDALCKFTADGNVFAVNTGRGLESTFRTCEELELLFHGSYLCCYNGAEIYSVDRGADVYRTGVPMELIPGILELSEKYDIHVHAYEDKDGASLGKHVLVTPREDEELEYYRRVIKTPYIVSEDIVSDLTAPSCKLIAIELHDRERIERFKAACEEFAGDRLTLLFSNPYYLEIFPHEAGKGSAVTRLCNMLDIPVENSFAAGDEENDISMIQAAGTGIAMLNATEPVKQKADVVTAADNNNDGLVPFL